MIRLCGMVLGAWLLSLTATAPARADGDDFFERPLNPDGSAIIEGGYAGSVKDERGRVVPDVTIKIVVTIDTPDGPTPLTLNAYSDTLGRYRSRDPYVVFADVIADSATVPAIALLVLKDGYVETRRLDRGRLQDGGPVETDFVLRKTPRK